MVFSICMFERKLLCGALKINVFSSNLIRFVIHLQCFGAIIGKEENKGTLLVVYFKILDLLTPAEGAITCELLFYQCSFFILHLL